MMINKYGKLEMKKDKKKKFKIENFINGIIGLAMGLILVIYLTPALSYSYWNNSRILARAIILGFYLLIGLLSDLIIYYLNKRKLKRASMIFRVIIIAALTLFTLFLLMSIRVLNSGTS